MVSARDGGEAPPDASERGYGPEDFPGCKSFYLPERALEYYKRRLEFWDGLTETAWMVPDTPTYHERPSRRLVEMATRVEMFWGSRIRCLGATGLVRRDAAGRLRWLIQADEIFYLHPERVRLAGPWIDVDTDPLPDVALEVDHSTDVRRRKLEIYKESGFPEIWVLVPWEFSVRAPGLAIHVRGEGGYREEAESRAFPGWKAEDIFGALTEEDPLPEGTEGALVRVARTMGAREGTRPEDDPIARSILQSVKTGGYRWVLALSREEGREEGLEHQRALLRRQAAARFGAAVEGPLAGMLARLADPERLAEAGEGLVGCDTGDDFLALVAQAVKRQGW